MSNDRHSSPHITQAERKWWKKKYSKAFRVKTKRALRSGKEPPKTVRAVSDKWDID